jgi:tetratricopeptide (TPR) repeat protein
MHSIIALRFDLMVSLSHLALLLTICVLLATGSVSAQQLEPVLVEGRPALKYTDKKGCESPVNFGKIAGHEEAVTIRVVHFHGSSWGEKGWFGITRSRIFFRPDAGQKDEHAFSILRNEFKEAKASKDGKIYYLTLVSKVKKNQEFAVGCFGNTHDIDEMFVPIVNYAVLASNDFDVGVKEFQQLTAQVQPQKPDQDATLTDLLGIGPKTSLSESASGSAKEEVTGDAKSYFNLGKTHLKLHLYDEAIRAFKQAVQARGEYVEAYVGLGDAYLYSGHYTEAIAAYTQAIKLNPNLAEAYNGLGIAYSDTFRPEEALKALKEAVRLQPDSPSNFYFMGLTYRKLGKRKEAIDALRETLRLNPGLTDAYETLGDIYSNSKEYDSAVEVYRSLVQLRAGSPVAHSNLANAYFSSGRRQEALDEYEVTIKLSPKDPSGYHNIGNTYAAMGRFDEAILSYKRAIALKSDYVPSHFMLGRAFFKKGDKASAVEEYKILKSLEPNAAKLLLEEISK